ncbi:hypothetical protein LJR029_002330 [Caballeronia sp. LjRoot29]|uniref:hypothetical protein n=1 Tax=Caballeronia sp. LjRoot29 TaxID=3342315 RepID=UPI003ED09E49
MTAIAELSSSNATTRTSVVPWKPPYTSRWIDRLQWVESVSSPVQEAAVPLLDAFYVSNPPRC